MTYSPATLAKYLAVSVLLAAGSSFAGASTLKLNTTSFSQVGGVFAVTNSDLDISSYSNLAMFQSVSGNNGLGFGTFCLEYSEPFNPGQTFDYTIASYANAGGVGGQTSPGQDPISKGTAWLYSQFATGTLADYLYAGTTAQRKASALELQNAFWFLEDEGQGSESNTYVALAIDHFSSLSSAKAASDGLFGVQVLNLTQNGVRKQSQLYYHQAPEAGATAAMIGLGFVALIGLRRKLSRTS